MSVNNTFSIDSEHVGVWTAWKQQQSNVSQSLIKLVLKDMEETNDVKQ